jgi:hypothetical protein
MRLKSFLFFLSGIFLGVAGFVWFQIGGISPPADQDTTRIEVAITQLKPKDQWLNEVHFQVVPLDGVRSVRHYFIILMTPPPGGIKASTVASSLIDLTSSINSEGVQPFEISPQDFGIGRDQPVLRFIEGGISLDHSNQKLYVSSSLY